MLPVASVYLAMTGRVDQLQVARVVAAALAAVDQVVHVDRPEAPREPLDPVLNVVRVEPGSVDQIQSAPGTQPSLTVGEGEDLPGLSHRLYPLASTVPQYSSSSGSSGDASSLTRM